jgi:hypothetical protein
MKITTKQAQRVLDVAVIDEEQTYVDGHGRTRYVVVAVFATLAEAEDFVAELEKRDPEKVHRGGYGIDGPEQG